jgi:RNA polymerase sigma factor (sigma-70 family)
MEVERSAALGEVYRSSHVGLVRLAHLLTGRRDDAEDIVQAVFASVAPRWSEVRNPELYLRSAVYRAANDLHRQNFRRQRRTIGEHATTPEIDCDHLRSDLAREIERLSTKQRTVVVLRYFEDRSFDEIATIMNRSPSTVRSDLRRALTYLRRHVPR